MDAENRKFARRDIDLAVGIKMADGSYLPGLVLDVSQSGARLKVDDPDRLPGQFMLKLSDKLHRWSRIVWRSIDEAGVEFLAAPQSADDSKAKPYVLIKCPRTGRDIWTGIRLTAADDLAKLAGVRRFAQCRHCKVVHGWTASEASLNAMPG
ncbi:MAG TPA: PilZ domain-containing protein [Xanthobacteraceae bacterium]